MIRCLPDKEVAQKVIIALTANAMNETKQEVLEAGMDGDYTIIFTKSVLDGFMAIVFAAALGIGTAFSALSVLVYQGALTLLAGLVAPYVHDIMLAELGATGGALIIMIGVNLMGLAKIKTANYLPALVLSVVFVVVQDVVGV